MNDKLYSVAGIATDTKGNTKVRYANDLVSRIKVLTRNNFTNINLIEFDTQYDKFEVCQMLLNDNRFSDYTDIIHKELEKINRIDEEYSCKLQRQQRKLALANISPEQVLELIK